MIGRVEASGSRQSRGESVPYDGAGAVFVVGSRRSGNTWLARSLATHPEVGLLMQTHLFWLEWPDLLEHGLRHIVEQVVRAGVCPKESRFALALRLASCSSSSLLVRELVAMYLQRHSLVAENTPRHINSIGRIKSALPRARIVAIVRDGRDVWASLRAYGRAQGWARRCSACDLAARDWVLEQERLFDAQRLFRDDVLVVRYEDLVYRYTETMGRVFAFLGVRYDQQLLLSVEARNSFFAYTGRRNGERKTGAFCWRGQAGAFRTDFSRAEIAQYESVADETLRSLGYAVLCGGS